MARNSKLKDFKVKGEGEGSDDFRKILRAQHNTTTNIAQCLEAITAVDGDTTVLQQLLTATQEDMEELDPVLRSCLETKFFNELTTPNSPALVSKVFETLELAEMILEYLDFPDLVLAPRVNKSFRTVVYSSTKLQRTLFLTSKPTDHFRLLPEHDNFVVGLRRFSVSGSFFRPVGYYSRVHPDK